MSAKSYSACGSNFKNTVSAATALKFMVASRYAVPCTNGDACRARVYLQRGLVLPAFRNGRCAACIVLSSWERLHATVLAARTEPEAIGMLGALSVEERRFAEDEDALTFEFGTKLGFSHSVDPYLYVHYPFLWRIPLLNYMDLRVQIVDGFHTSLVFAEDVFAESPPPEVLAENTGQSVLLGLYVSPPYAPIDESAYFGAVLRYVLGSMSPVDANRFGMRLLALRGQKRDEMCAQWITRTTEACGWWRGYVHYLYNFMVLRLVPPTEIWPREGLLAQSGRIHAAPPPELVQLLFDRAFAHTCAIELLVSGHGFVPIQERTCTLEQNYAALPEALRVSALIDYMWESGRHETETSPAFFVWLGKRLDAMRPAHFEALLAKPVLGVVPNVPHIIVYTNIESVHYSIPYCNSCRRILIVTCRKAPPGIKRRSIPTVYFKMSSVDVCCHECGNSISNALVPYRIFSAVGIGYMNKNSKQGTKILEGVRGPFLWVYTEAGAVSMMPDAVRDDAGRFYPLAALGSKAFRCKTCGGTTSYDLCELETHPHSMRWVRNEYNVLDYELVCSVSTKRVPSQKHKAYSKYWPRRQGLLSRDIYMPRRKSAKW